MACERFGAEAGTAGQWQKLAQEEPFSGLTDHEGLCREPVWGLLVFGILLGESWPKMSQTRTPWGVLSLQGRFIHSCLFIHLCLLTYSARDGRARSSGSQEWELLHWFAGRMGAVDPMEGSTLCRKEPGRASEHLPQLGG